MHLSAIAYNLKKYLKFGAKKAKSKVNFKHQVYLIINLLLEFINGIVSPRKTGDYQS